MLNEVEYDSGLSKTEEIELNKYFVFKGILSLLYDGEYDKRYYLLEDALIIDNDNFLVPLSNILEVYNSVMDKGMKENVNKIIDYFRNKNVINDPEQKEKICESVNKIIVSNNSSNTNYLKEFMRQEWTLRFGEDEFNWIEMCGKLNEAYIQLKYLFTQDFDILYTHFCCLDEDFDLISDAFADVNSIYMASINKMIYECPLLLKDALFINRVHKVIFKLRDNLKGAKRRDCAAPRRLLRKRFKKDHNVFLRYLLDDLTTD